MFSLITPVYSHVILQKSLKYADLLFNKLSFLSMLKTLLPTEKND